MSGWPYDIIKHEQSTKIFIIACLPVQWWSNFGLISTFVVWPAPAQFLPLVIHNYCQSQISFPEYTFERWPTQNMSKHYQKSDWLYKVNHGVGPVKGMICRPQISMKCWCFFLLDEHVSWSVRTKQSKISCFRESPVLYREIFVKHTRLNNIKISLQI